MKKKTREIKLDQLCDERSFLSFCNDDQRGNHGKRLGMEITHDFLVACEKDGFIIPLLTRTESRMVEGKETQVEVKYYSPFQIFLVTELCKNVIDEDGYLRDLALMDADYQKQQKTRYINWGGHMAFNIDNEKTESGNPSAMISHFTLMKDFHNFLRLLHTFDTFDNTRNDDYVRRRLYRNAPKLQYDFKELSAELLSEYNTNTDKIKTIFKIVGNIGLSIDPLEEWFNYVHRHEIMRKDELKGLAGVAQELYNFCDVLREVVETVDGKKLPPFLEFVKSDFGYHDREKMNKFAEGEDIVAIKKANENLIEWLTKNKEFIDGVFAKHPEWEKVDFLDLANKTRITLDDFHTRYGDIRYVGAYRTMYPSDKKVEELDDATKRILDMYTRSRLHHQKDEDDDYEIDIQMEISQAISSRLSDLERDVVAVAYKLSDLFQSDISRVEGEKRMSVGPLQQEYFKDREHKDDPNPGLTNSLFWREFLPKGQKKYDDEMEMLGNKRSELNHIWREAGLVFCAKCREKKVILHQLHLDEKFSTEAICDDCVASSDLSTIKSGEWCCEHINHEGNVCGRMLYKFAHNNILSSILKNTANTKVTLNYGQMEIEISCPECRQKSTKMVEWGWLP
jgi:hypothetical protein